MTASPGTVTALVLAAGRGSRLGGPKALLHVDARTTFLAQCAAILGRPGVSHVLAVVGHESARVVAAGGPAPGLAFVFNPRHAEGMVTSIWAGLDAAEALGAEAVLVHPVDHPLVAPGTVDRVVAALQAGATVAVPSHLYRRGHPTGFARAAWPALRGADPRRGARGVLEDHAEWIAHVPGDPGCLAGIDTPDDYRRLLGRAPF